MTVAELMNETVVYGGLLVTRYDMYADLLRKGVVVTGKASPGAYRYMSADAVDAKPEWEFQEGEFRNVTNGTVIREDGRISPGRRTTYLGHVLRHDGYDGATCVLHLCVSPKGGVYAAHPSGWHKYGHSIEDALGRSDIIETHLVEG